MSNLLNYPSFLRDGAAYDLLNQDRVQDIDFYVRTAQESGGPVLELCCGTGRVTIPVAQAGLDITGLEINASMLAQAQRKAPRDLQGIRWVQGNATYFEFARKFRLIMLPFNSMQLLGDNRALKSFFRNVHAHLEPDGWFVFDVMNPNPGKLASGPKTRYDAGKYLDPSLGEEVSLEWEGDYDDIRQVNRITFYFSSLSKQDFFSDVLEQRCFFPQEIAYWLDANGFEIVQRKGAFEKDSFERGDLKQIFICKKR